MASVIISEGQVEDRKYRSMRRRSWRRVKIILVTLGSVILVASGVLVLMYLRYRNRWFLLLSGIYASVFAFLLLARWLLGKMDRVRKKRFLPYKHKPRPDMMILEK
ncbi:MAG: hypothetical protein JXN60_06515 [Lentisphaerae bacterium]|nr:hypothetical protein [Lentisphaerota bacterium]